MKLSDEDRKRIQNTFNAELKNENHGTSIPKGTKACVL